MIDLLLKSYGVKFVTEYKFHPSRRWRFDYAVPDKKIAIEYEGATWARGRHTRGAGYAKDCEKYSVASIMGWTIIRITTDMLKNGMADNLLRFAFNGIDYNKKTKKGKP